MQGAEQKDSPSAAAVQARHAIWLESLPADEQALWDWLIGLDQEERLALLAHCVSYGVNALFEKVDRYGAAGMSQSSLDRRLRQADRLAAAVDLDMVAAGWRPTVDTYLGKVTKPRILEAVREACGENAAQLIDHLKKGDMAREAERLLSDRGWLPEVLRTPVAEVETDPAAAEPLAPLPAFLSAADPGPAGEPDGDVVLAAE